MPRPAIWTRAPGFLGAGLASLASVAITELFTGGQLAPPPSLETGDEVPDERDPKKKAEDAAVQ